MILRLFISLCFFPVHVLNVNGRQDSLGFKGQLPLYLHYNPRNELPLLGGARYIPQLNYSRRFENDRLLDFEASLNIYGNAGLDPFDSVNSDGVIKPYRLWARYSTHQFELRAGLQKINFGSASILRPLMWFDRIDPRDPLKLTDGVWGVLARYYFLDNANIWLWGLAGNEDPKGWETFSTRSGVPEFGGRLQLPVPRGEAGFSYHHRVADLSALTGVTVSRSPENRLGFDARFDMVVGWWAEASWSSYNEKAGIYSSQEVLNLGIDYTFGLGNGLTVIYEQLVASHDEDPFTFTNASTFSLLSLSYPSGLFSSLGAIIYYDWTNSKAYNFITWQRQFSNFTFYLMGYVNPAEYNIPAQNTEIIIYAGSGLQLMLVFNH